MSKQDKGDRAGRYYYRGRVVTSDSPQQLREEAKRTRKQGGKAVIIRKDPNKPLEERLCEGPSGHDYYIYQEVF